MPMKLTLAIALDCFPTECRVQLVDSGETQTVHYAAPVQARLKIYPGQLVALDTNPAIPEIVYRWHYVKVEQLKGDTAVIKDHQGQLVELVNAPGLPETPQVGDWVFATLGGNVAPSELFDIAVDGRPAHPAFLSDYAFPKVEEFYQKIMAR
ncbi:MAG TPA: hypothetical protein VH186_02755 [Chloroflexia bacterium]|nr:hypothetical protein [Chloroflexia bacterium]